MQEDNSGTLSRNYSARVTSSSSSVLRSTSTDMADQPNAILRNPLISAHRPDVVNVRDAKYIAQEQQQKQRSDEPKMFEPPLPSPSKPHKQFGSKRLVALAAALDAGELLLVQ